MGFTGNTSRHRKTSGAKKSMARHPASDIAGRTGPVQDPSRRGRGFRSLSAAGEESPFEPGPQFGLGQAGGFREALAGVTQDGGTGGHGK